MKYDPRTALKSENGKSQEKQSSFTLKKPVFGPADPGIDDTAVTDPLQPYGSQNKKTSGSISTKNNIDRTGNDKTSPAAISRRTSNRNDDSSGKNGKIGVIKLIVQDKVLKLSQKSEAVDNSCDLSVISDFNQKSSQKLKSKISGTEKSVRNSRKQEIEQN